MSFSVGFTSEKTLRQRSWVLTAPTTIVCCTEGAVLQQRFFFCSFLVFVILYTNYYATAHNNNIVLHDVNDFRVIPHPSELVRQRLDAYLCY